MSPPLPGVSQQTVSRVVNDRPNVSEFTRRRVQEAMDRLGFRPNYAGRSLRGGRYLSVGLCAYDITQVGNLTMLDGIMGAARKHGYAITLVEMSKVDTFLARRGVARVGGTARGRRDHRHEPAWRPISSRSRPSPACPRSS